MRAAFVIIGILADGFCAQAIGAQKPRPTALKLAASINLENKSPIALLNFEIVMSAKDRTPEMVFGKLEKPLAAGGEALFPLTGGKGGTFEARWAFGDMKDVGDAELCNDRHIALVD